MTNSTQSKPTPMPAIIVYGTPSSPELTQASWFRAEDAPAAQAAAVGLKFSVLDIQNDDARALTVGVHEGVLKGSGRMIIGTVDHAVYRRIQEYANKASVTDASVGTPNTKTAAAKSATEQNVNFGNTSTPPSTPASKIADSSSTASAPASPKSAPSLAPDIKPSSPAKPEGAPAKPGVAPPPTPSPWDNLKVGSHVVAKHWEADGEPYGWWVGTITGFEKDDFVVVWLDYPSKMPPFRIERKNVAILHPAFDLKTERERKRR